MIGVFDSGVGGLTVVKQIFKNRPNQKIIYFGDTARLPYGTKGADFVKKYSEKITEWLLNKGVEKIVVACHTSSALAGDYLKEKFGDRIIDMITPVAEKISGGKIGIIGTPGTIKSKAWEKSLLKINPKLKIYSKACPLFVPLVEEGLINTTATQEIVRNYLKNFKNIDTLVLACTHYPLLKNIIRKEIGKNVEIIDPAVILARELNLDSRFRGNDNNSEFYFSDTPYNFEKISKLCLKKSIKPIVSDPF